MRAARDALVLVHVIVQCGALGPGQPLAPAQLAALQGVQAQVAAALQRATLVAWLCGTHASATGV